MRRSYKIGLIILALLGANTVRAQFTVDGQLIQRGEYRHGYGTPIEEGKDAALSIGQRARLGAQYKADNFTFFVSIQDVRTWGSTPQIKTTDPFLSVHEAWAETKLGEQFSIKLGRQELNYDNARFLGNLDWALQGRAHDFALLKWEKEARKFHLGAAYNQNADSLAGRIYTMTNQYKAAQFARYENTIGNFQYAFLFWNNGLQYLVYDDALTNPRVIEKGIRYMQTLGVPTLKYQAGNTTFSGFYYHQFGSDRLNRKVNAFDASVQISHLFKLDEEKGSAFRLTAGIEVISGTENPNTDNRNRSFAPLYGTNHAHNGYMDLFFVGGRHEQNRGLSDLFMRTRYDVNKKLFLSANIHYFGTAAGRTEDPPTRLGTELDLSLGYLINDAVSLQSGYSQLFNSERIANLRNLQDPSAIQNWAYIMMIYRPTMKNKFIGLLF